MIKDDRLNKIIKSDGKTVIVPMDHGVSDGLVAGIENMGEVIEKVKMGGADAVVIHKGIVKQHQRPLEGLPYLIHISASTGMGNILKKVLVADVRECAELGATGVSIHVNLGNEYEPEMLEDFGRISRDCEREGMPLLAMMYVRDLLEDELINDTSVESVAHAARIAYELGADIVKVNYTGTPEEFKRVVEGCSIPLVIAGGSKLEKDDFMIQVKGALQAGAIGLSCGRNVFQAKDVESMVREISSFVHNSF